MSFDPSSPLGRALGFFSRGLLVILPLARLILLEFLVTFFLGAAVIMQIVDYMGWTDYSPVEQSGREMAGFGTVGSVSLWFLLRGIWNPVAKAPRPAGGAFGQLFVHGSSIRLSTHPSHVLLDVLALVPPLAIILIAGNDPSSAPVRMGHWWLVTGGAILAFRLFAWCVLRRGPALVQKLAAEAGAAEPPARRRAFDWEHFWSGPAALWMLMLLLMGPILVAYRQTIKL